MKRHLLAFVGVFALGPLAACSTPGTPPAQNAAMACPGNDAVVARIGSQTITMGELDKKAAAELFEAREKALDNLVTERALEPEAKKAGLSLEEYVKKAVETKVPSVTEKEAEAFFTQNKDKLPPQLAAKSFPEVKDVIVGGLTQQKRQEAVGEVIDDLKKKAGVQILLEAPKVEVAATGPSRGPKDAKVTIVEFSDFQCPFCSRGRQTVDQVMKAYPGKVRLVFRDFPLSFHDKAEKAAEAGQCANEQGEEKFWAMHDWMFDNQSKLGVEDLKAGAKTIGLDEPKFAACLDSGKFKAAVDANVKAGEAAGVRGTPAFVINGTFLSGAQPFEKFKAEIDKQLAK